MRSYSNLTQDLLLANAKLDKMTSTVKQLGTKLKTANQIIYDQGHELACLSDQSVEYYKIKEVMAGFTLTEEEKKQREKSAFVKSPLLMF